MVLRPNRWIIWLCAALIAWMPPGRAAASAQPLVTRSAVSTAFFATVSSLVLYDREGPEREALFKDTWAEAQALLQEIESQVSLSDPLSDVSLFNALSYGESLAVRPHTAAILSIAREIWEESGGLYDPSVSPLVDLWGFTPRFNTNIRQAEKPYDRPYAGGKMPLPEAKYLRAFTGLTGFGGIVLEEDERGARLRKMIPPVRVDGVSYQAAIDLGGIAKGYAADRVIDLVRSKGYRRGCFVCGGSSLVVMRNKEKDAFNLGIRAPRGSQVSFMRMDLADTALSSSGDYNHFFTRDGVVYCHLINPFTGMPVNMPGPDGVQRGIAAVTLAGESAAKDDALTTMLCVMGPEKALAYANEKLRGRPFVMVLFRQGLRRYEVVTNLPEGRFQMADGAYHLASRTDAEGRVHYTGELMRP